MKYLTMEITIGCTVVGRSFSNEIIRGKVIGHGTKNGKRLVDIKAYGGICENHWLYIDQIEQVMYG